MLAESHRICALHQLFVATHVIPESHSDSGKHLSNLGRVSLTVGGMAAPFLLQLAVGHSH